MPGVRLKRIYDEPEPEDGLRILVTRYWPRGVPREKADWYEPKAAPSRELLHAFKHEGLPWDRLRRSFHGRNEIARSAECDRAPCRCRGKWDHHADVHL